MAVSSPGAHVGQQAGRVQHSYVGPLSRGVPGPFRPSNAQVEAWKKGTMGFMEKLRHEMCGRSSSSLEAR